MPIATERLALRRFRESDATDDLLFGLLATEWPSLTRPPPAG